MRFALQQKLKYCDRATPNSQEVGSVVALEYTQKGKQVYLGLSSFPGLAQLSTSCGESLGMKSQEHKGLLQALDSTQALGLRVVSRVHRWLEPLKSTEGLGYELKR